MDWQGTEGALRYLLQLKLVLPAMLLAGFWAWETWRPFFGHNSRLGHAGRNLALALFNTALLTVLFSSATVAAAAWTESRQVGLLNALALSWPVQFALGIVLLDAWMYAWHRANHTIPVLWRFHRMHHTDCQMDVTTATRFHLGELAASQILRLGLIPLLGLGVWQIVVYEMLVTAITQFHHADISLGRLDRWLRLLIVTPDVHKVHHSRRPHETHSNYSTFFSWWDRLARSFRMRPDLSAIEFGLNELTEPKWQTLWGMFRTPVAEGDRVQSSGFRTRKLEPVRRPSPEPRTLNPEPSDTLHRIA